MIESILALIRSRSIFIFSENFCINNSTFCDEDVVLDAVSLELGASVLGAAGSEETDDVNGFICCFNLSINEDPLWSSVDASSTFSALSAPCGVCAGSDWGGTSSTFSAPSEFCGVCACSDGGGASCEACAGSGEAGTVSDVSFLTSSEGLSESFSDSSSESVMPKSSNCCFRSSIFFRLTSFVCL